MASPADSSELRIRSANVVVAGIAARNGHPIGFWQFTRYGLVVTVATLAVSSLYVWLRYFVLA